MLLKLMKIVLPYGTNKELDALRKEVDELKSKLQEK